MGKGTYSKPNSKKQNPNSNTNNSWHPPLLPVAGSSENAAGYFFDIDTIIDGAMHIYLPEGHPPVTADSAAITHKAVIEGHNHGFEKFKQNYVAPKPKIGGTKTDQNYVSPYDGFVIGADGKYHPAAAAMVKNAAAKKDASGKRKEAVSGMDIKAIDTLLEWQPIRYEPAPKRPPILPPFAKKILDKIHTTEGGYVDLKTDTGGKTKYGIAEKGEWQKFAKFTGINPNVENIKNITAEQADKYYIHTRFEPYRINYMQNEKVANAVFDQSVITPGKVNANMKRALNDLGYKFKVNSTALTYKEIEAINAADADELVNKFVAHQLDYYEKLKTSKKETTRKNYKASIHGWKDRLDAIKNYKS